MTYAVMKTDPNIITLKKRRRAASKVRLMVWMKVEHLTTFTCETGNA